ncbi:MAG: sulfur reduction protein DsrE [candidate division Zixibacteria bacterium]|nr:sulfur reduction protein DsrE [candidate division Zixibacteria bacterium]
MKVLLILSHKPYDGTDVIWNGIRIANTLSASGDDVWVFVMNDAVDIVRESITHPEDFFDLKQMTKDMIAGGITVRACGTCLERTGSNPGEMAYEGVIVSDLKDLSEWIHQSDKMITF